MKSHCSRFAILLLSLLGGLAQAGQLSSFTPSGEAAEVSQVTATFDAPLRALGEPGGADPFTWYCDRGVAANARWIDPMTWALDFEAPLPAGVSCEFTPLPGLKDLAGQVVRTQARYRFNTGGPMARQVTTPQAWRGVDEDAVFFVRSSGELDFSTIDSHAWCEIEGVGEKIPVRQLSVAERKELFNATGEPPANQSAIAVLRCARRLPNGARVFLNWGAGIKGSSGLATSKTTRHEFRVRKEFSVEVSCPRENAKAGCNPFGNVPLRFSAPVQREDAGRLRLSGPGGRQWAPAMMSWSEGGDSDSEVVDQVEFKGPFPPEVRLGLTVPAQIRDEAGRPLANRDRLAKVSLETAAYPPLLKFAADFGIVERKAGGMLPATLRNLDPLPGQFGLKTADNSPPGSAAKLRLLHLKSDEDYFAWRRRVVTEERSADSRAHSYLRGESKARTLLVPKPNGARAMEVVGIPLGEPGYYVVEAESQILGRSLLGANRPMYVRTEALNTNLAVHFKQGEENQLVWVTALDTGKPVADARISIRDCLGSQIAFGKTGADGTMAVKRRLPPSPQRCDGGTYGYFVSARSKQGGVEDFSFVFSHWQQGIEPWRYQLPYAGTVPDVMLHTVFDRPLFRAGETVNMKHLARRRLSSGFGWVAREQLPDKAVIQLEGSELQFELPLVWKGGSAESSWTIPSEARLGKYWVSFARSGERVERVYGGDGEGDGEGWWPSGRFWRGGSFRVAEFRLPVLKGEVAFRQAAVVGDTPGEVDLRLNYLAGGAAGGEKVRLRSQMTPLFAAPEGFADYQFASQPVDADALKAGAWQRRPVDSVVFDDQRDLALDAAGSRRVTIGNTSPWDVPGLLRTEMEYSDPNGEIHTASATTRWFPAGVVAGIAAEGAWSPDGKGSSGKLRLLTLDSAFKPLAAQRYEVQAWQIKTRVHRKRLIGGLYSYDTQYETAALAEVCRGQSKADGTAECALNLPPREKGVQSIQLVLQLKALDSAGRASYASTALHLSAAGSEENWYEQGDSERIDLIPERKKYEAGDTAVFTVKMPFRQATALVSVEREGIIDRFVTELSGARPTVSVPIKPHYGPNVFVSVLAVRGRVGDVQPTALVDLGKPAYKLGIAEIEVGRKGYELKVEVIPEQAVYKTRQEATVKVRVSRPDGTPARGGEFVLAAVDEALLELAPNPSWQLLERLMARRGYGLQTATAQSQVIGKRHFGLKALPAGGGGGRQPTRELFDTLIKWQARVSLDEQGEARVTLPLNDSLTRIRVVAVAHQGAALFGTGMASFRTSKDVQLFSGLPPVVRDADRFRAGFTVRNLTAQDARFAVGATLTAETAGKSVALPALPAHSLQLAAGEAREVAWQVTVPAESTRLDWRAEAQALATDGTALADARDALKVSQKVLAAVPVSVQAATLEQLDRTFVVPVARPADALAGRGGVDVFLKAKLGASTDGVRAWMSAYPYSCLEQQLSKAVATGDLRQWQQIQATFPSYLDNNGLASYFKNPRPNSGSPTLTAYILDIAPLAGYPLPDSAREAMLGGLALFIQGRIAPDQPYWSPRDDLPVRKLKALEALSRHGRATPELLATVAPTPGAWPTSAVVSWLNILVNMPALPKRAALIAEAEQNLRARLLRSGTLTQFAREREDYWWWLMDSPDGTVARAVIALMALPGWQAEIPRLVRGAMSRQRDGHWDNTLANVWGVVMLERFGRQFESTPVEGTTAVSLGGATQRFDWSASVAADPVKPAAGQPVPPVGSAWRDPGSRLRFDWPAGGKGEVTALQEGSGKPWLTVQTRAARQLKAPVYAGFELDKKITPVEQKTKGRWSRGDVVEVALTVSAPATWTWVVIDDPVPAGATILGTGLGGESAVASNAAGVGQGGNEGRVEIAHTERSFDAYRSYYEFFDGSAKTPHRLTYRLRLNNAGEFQLPPTRVEAMYAPENFGELPNSAWSVAE